MVRNVTRRRTLVLGGTVLATTLAGCSSGGSGPDVDESGAGDGTGGDDTGNAGGGETGDSGDGDTGDGAAGGDQGDAGGEQATVSVGSLSTVGPLEVLVSSVERLESAPIFGLQLRAAEGNVYVAPTVTLKNAGDGYAAVSMEALSVTIDGETYSTDEPYLDIYSPEFGGLPLAPGELRTFTIHFEVPDGGENGRLLLGVRTRSLPAGFGSTQFLAVALDNAASSPESLSQSLQTDLLAFGETAAFDGLEASVRGVSFPTEVAGREPPEGSEFVAVSLSATHGADIPNNIVVGIGGFGGMTVHDDNGNAFTGRIPFNGTLDDESEFFATNGIAPGERLSGVSVATVPEGTTPLYLMWSPPPQFWTEGTGATSNRVGWQLR